MNKTQIKISGMTCHSCEILLERKLKKIKGVTKVEVSYTKGLATVYYDKKKPSQTQLNEVIEKAGYYTKDSVKKDEISRKRHFLEIGAIGIIVLAIFLFLGELELFSSVAVNENMSLGLVFLIGIVAAFSSCLAVTGGLLVSVTAKYAQNNPNLSGFQKFKPHAYFNVGRILGYTILGGLIGAFGSLFTFSTAATGFITILAAIIMILLGLQLLDLTPNFLHRLRPRMPKYFAHKIMKSSNSSNKSAPFFLGGATFFLPCGFTQALQLYVLSKGDPMMGAMTMFVFSLGTLPGLLSLGVLSSFLQGSAKRYFFKTAGVVVVLLGLFTIPSGLTLAGISATDTTEIDTESKPKNLETIDNNVRIEDGYQIVEMKINRYSYYPSKFTIYEDMPVKWVIDGTNAAGCARVLTIPELNLIEMIPRGEKIIEFTPNKVGKLEFMCSMAMTTPGAAFTVIENPNSKASCDPNITTCAN